MTAFYSRLPITYQDDIAVFVLASKKRRVPSSPFDANNLVPIAPPFFGKYNDYGGVMDVVDDMNHMLFTKRFGIGIDKFVGIMHDLSGLTISGLRNGIEEFKDKTRAENKFHHETAEDYKWLMELYDRLLPPYMPDREEVSLAVTMELKDIYDKMVELGKDNRNAWLGHRPTIEEAFDNTRDTLEIVRKSKVMDYTFNPLQYTNVPYTLLFGRIESISEVEQMEEGISILKKVLSDKRYEARNGLSYRFGLLYDPYANILYDDFEGNIEDYREILVDYAYFMYTFDLTCSGFSVSPSHNQDVAFEVLVPLYKKMQSLMSKPMVQETNVRYLIGCDVNGGIEYMQEPSGELEFLPKINDRTKRFKTIDELRAFMDANGGMEDCDAYCISEDVTITPVEL